MTKEESREKGSSPATRRGGPVVEGKGTAKKTLTDSFLIFASSRRGVGARAKRWGPPGQYTRTHARTHARTHTHTPTHKRVSRSASDDAGVRPARHRPGRQRQGNNTKRGRGLGGVGGEGWLCHMPPRPSLPSHPDPFSPPIARPFGSTAPPSAAPCTSSIWVSCVCERGARLLSPAAAAAAPIRFSLTGSLSLSPSCRPRRRGLPVPRRL